MSDRLAVDIETSGLSLAHDSFTVGATGYARDYCMWDDPVELCRHIIDHWRSGGILVGHNLWAFDIPMLARSHPPFAELAWKHRQLVTDTLIRSRLALSNQRRSHSLSAWAEDLRKDGAPILPKFHMDFSNPTPKDLAKRLRADISITTALDRHLSAHFRPDSPARHLETLIAPFLAAMSIALHKGVPLAAEDHAPIFDKLERRMRVLELTLRRILPGVSKPNSNHEVDRSLRQHYGTALPSGPPSPKLGKVSPLLNKDNSSLVLARMPWLRPLMEWRRLRQARPYIAGIGDTGFWGSNWIDGHTFPSLSLLSQAALRSSYSAPPLNQTGPHVRPAVRLDGNTFVGCDVTGLEFGCLAWYLMDWAAAPALWQEVQEGTNPKDRHLAAFAPFLRNFPPSERAATAKRYFFAAVYGMGREAQLRTLRMWSSDPAANERTLDALQQAWQTRAPGLTRLRAEVHRRSRPPHGSIANLYGVAVRPRKDHSRLNALIQSTGALYSYALLGDYFRRLRSLLPTTIPVLSNHDELLCRVPLPPDQVRGPAEQAARLAWEGMRPKLGRAEIKLGPSWKDAH